MTAVFETVLNMSAGAGILALLVLGARAVIGRRAAAFLPVLYALLFLRLALPVSIPSPLSVQNVLPIPGTGVAARGADAQAGAALEEAEVAAEPQPGPAPNAAAAGAAALPAQSGARITGGAGAGLSVWDIAAIIWLAGAAALLMALLLGNTLFARRLKKNRVYDAPGLAALLDGCKAQMGIKRRVSVIRCGEAGTAAVYGVLRPKLLIAPGAFGPLSKAQKRHVLLHELAHIRRGDTLTGLAATALCVLHWFNPLVWAAFHLMRRDAEVLCDAAVLRGLDEDGRQSYAATLLRLAGPPRAPRLVTALFISKANIKRRMTMIVQHRKKSALFTALAALLTLFVAAAGCATALTEDAPPAAPAAPIVEEMPIATPVPAATPAPEPAPIPGPVLMSTFALDCGDIMDTGSLHNIRKTVEMLDGAVINPGAAMSLRALLGPRTEANGWKAAGIITDGVYMDAYGAGIGIASTALYNAALCAELDIVESARHSIMPVYAAGGLDAATGLIVANPYDIDVTIGARLEDDTLTVDIYGPPRAYTVAYTSRRRALEEPPEEIYHYNADTLPTGEPIPPGGSVTYISSRAAVLFDVYKTLYDTEGRLIKTGVDYTGVYPEVQGAVYVNGPEPG